MPPWWDPAPNPRLSQGDIVLDVPAAVALYPIAQLIRNKGETEWRESSTWVPNKEGVGNLVARGRVTPVIVISHDCEMDKNESKNRVAIAPIVPIERLAEAERDIVLAQRRYSKMRLSDPWRTGGAYERDVEWEWSFLYCPYNRRR